MIGLKIYRLIYLLKLIRSHTALLFYFDQTEVLRSVAAIALSIRCILRNLLALPSIRHLLIHLILLRDIPSSLCCIPILHIGKNAYFRRSLPNLIDGVLRPSFNDLVAQTYFPLPLISHSIVLILYLLTIIL